MSERFTTLFFTLTLLVNIYFLIDIEPNELRNQADRLLALFLFQFDYFFLFVYIISKLLKNFQKPLFLLAFCYCSLFLIGMSSFYITDEKQFDTIYSYVQPIIRLTLVYIFYEMGILSGFFNDKKNVFLSLIGVVVGLYFLYLLNRHPRSIMLFFNAYWLSIMVFLLVGIQIKSHEKTNRTLFIIGLFCTFLADLYYILPPEERKFELTYMVIRVINTIGEFLIVNHVLRFYASTTSKR